MTLLDHVEHLFWDAHDDWMRSQGFHVTHTGRRGRTYRLPPPQLLDVTTPRVYARARAHLGA